ALDEVAAVELEDAGHGGLPLLGLLVVRVELLHRERCPVHVPPHHDLPPRRRPLPSLLPRLPKRAVVLAPVRRRRR
ncbi:Os11g0662950, partial [Oryza sativa Japonica Group]